MNALKAKSMARALFIYGLLIGGAAIFTIPFIWMIGTSLKVDREMFGEGITLLPRRPVPAQSSPYLDARYFKTPATPEAKKIKTWVTTRVLELNPDAEADALFPGIYKRLRDTLPNEVWRLPDVKKQAEVIARIDDQLIDSVYRAIYRPLTLGSVRVRSFDLQEQEMTTGRTIPDLWQLESNAEAEIRAVEDPTGAAGVLAYDFTGDGDTITLYSDLELPFAAERLFRIQLSITPDDSWHRMDFTFERNGALYRSMRPAFLGENNAMVVTLQEYGPEDESDSGKIRLWYACEEIDRGPQYESRPNHVKVTIDMTESSQLQAWWAKAYRNYRGALNYIPFGRYLATSAFLVILNIIGNIFSCSLVAFAFARLQWPGRQFSFALMMATLMIPPQVTMIPYFLIIKHLGWYNTLTPLWFISFFGNAFNIFLLRQFMK
ncbi:MAG: hypothetical protein ACO398_04495, partial [Kiritimatiellia bacterium]